MQERQFFYVGKSPISVPGLVEAMHCETEYEDQEVYAPMFWSSQTEPESMLADIEEQDPQSYLQMVENYGQDLTNRAYDNTPPSEVYAIDGWLLAEHLKDSTPKYVMVDGSVRPVSEFIAEIS